MRPKNPPAPVYTFAYRRPPRSGNETNGLGVSRRVRARKVYHGADGAPPLAWHALNARSAMLVNWRTFARALANRWQLRRSVGPVAAKRLEVTDPTAMTTRIKQLAGRHGADLVGVTTMGEDAVYDEPPAYGEPLTYRFAICLGRAMTRAEVVDIPGDRAQAEVQRTYRLVARAAIGLAEDIRAMGWPARAFGDSKTSDILHIPLAIRAGLGELGKHGSLISRPLGSGMRLATVLTDLPLTIDAPVDLGVDDFCASCRRCVEDCPPDAIFETKQMVRGTPKWYVNFDKCIPYFAMTRGCGICIHVCPWSSPGAGAAISTKMLAKRKKQQVRSGKAD